MIRDDETVTQTVRIEVNIADVLRTLDLDELMLWIRTEIGDESFQDLIKKHIT